MTDINLGIYTARLDPARSIYATSEKLSIRYHTYEDVRFKDFVRGLLRLPLRRRKLGRIPHPAPLTPHSALRTPHSHRPDHRPPPLRAAQRVPARTNTVVVADVGDALFGAADLVHPRAHRVHQPGLLHLDGFRRAREHRRATGQPEAAPAGAGRRRRLPDDRHGTGHGRPLRAQPGRGAAEQPRLRHRAAHAGRPLQRRLAVAISPPAGDPGRRPRLRGGDRGGSGPRAGRGAQHTASFCLLEVLLDPLDRSPALQRLGRRLGAKI